MSKETKKQFGIHFGIMSDSFRKQIKVQGFKFDEEVVRHFELDSDALNRLRIRGYLTDTATDNATKKLFNKLKQHISKLN